MTRWIAMASLFALTGCSAAGLVRKETAPLLNCPETAIKVEQKDKTTWFAQGCERAAVCTDERGEGGEIRCAGGGPAALAQTATPPADTASPPANTASTPASTASTPASTATSPASN